MLTAKDLMTRECVTVRLYDDITQAAQLLLEKGYNGVPVLDENDALVGILCQSDLIAQQKRLTIPSVFTILDGFFPLASTSHLEREMKKITATKVHQAMTPNPRSVTPDTTIEDIATTMAEEKLYTLPVVENGKIVGVLGKSDILRALVDKSGRSD